MAGKKSSSDARKGWKRALTDEQKKVLFGKGTEPAFCGIYWNHKEEGIYRCASCGAKLFASGKKFDSGTGWPSFFSPISANAVKLEDDSSHGMRRTEVQCGKCGGHLGHVFNDGPPPTGKRYCINSASLSFEKTKEAGQGKEAGRKGKGKLEKAIFAAGCFWGVEAAFARLPGVKKTIVGYTGGRKASPTYEEVCTGRTGHAEAVLVEFDPRETSYGALLEAFWKMHDPTQGSRQGPDMGEQYRSAIFCFGKRQQNEAEASLENAQSAGKFGQRKITTEILPAGKFWVAEEYHQQYYKKNPFRKICRI